MPGGGGAVANDIDGSNIVGIYDDASGAHGFLYTIPEPATLLPAVSLSNPFLGLGGLLLRKRKA